MTEPKQITIGKFTPQTGKVEPLGRTYFFYGPYGSGKSHMAASAIELGKTLWIITDANTDSILLKFPSENVQRIYISRYVKTRKKIRNPENPKEIIEIETREINPTAFMDFCEVIDDLWANDCYDFDFVVIDSMTTIGEMCMDMVQLKNSAVPIDDAPQIQHYGHQIRQLMARCGYGIQDTAKATKTTFIVTCHDRMSEDKKAGTIGINPALAGMAGRTIGKEYEEVWYFRAVTLEGSRSKSGFEARTRGTALIAAKTQIDTMPDVIPHANLNMKWVLETREKFLKSIKN